jgi:hypothetical protein
MIRVYIDSLRDMLGNAQFDSPKGEEKAKYTARKKPSKKIAARK